MRGLRTMTRTRLGICTVLLCTSIYGSTPPYQVKTETLACTPFECSQSISLDIGQSAYARTDIFASCYSNENISAFGSGYTSGCSVPAVILTDGTWGESTIYNPPVEVGYLDDLGNYDLAETVLGDGSIYVETFFGLTLLYEMDTMADCFSGSTRVNIPPPQPC